MESPVTVTSLSTRLHICIKAAAFTLLAKGTPVRTLGDRIWGGHSGVALGKACGGNRDMAWPATLITSPLIPPSELVHPWGRMLLSNVLSNQLLLSSLPVTIYTISFLRSVLAPT